MIVDIVVPQLGEGTDAVILVEWHVSVGDTVEEGDILFDVDVDKAVVEVAAFASGVVVEVIAGDDTEVMPLEVVGRLRTSGQSGQP